MSIIRRTSELRKLDEFDMLIEDGSANSPLYFNVYDIPEVFPAGRTAFLINGSDNLILDTEVEVEVRDANGDVIYSEYPQYLEGVSRLVSVWVYPETTHGTATITVLGNAKRMFDQFGREVPIPDEWKNIFNVRWQKIVMVNPERKNNSRIRFYKQPRILAGEIFQEYLDRTLVSDSYDLMSGSILGVQSSKSQVYYILTDKATGAGTLQFSSEMSGARLVVPKPDITGSTQTNAFPLDLDQNSPPAYETIVGKVLNESVAICEPPYRITSSKTVVKTSTKLSKTTGEVADDSVFRFSLSPYTMSINTPPTYSITENFRSYARLQIVDMGTFSGDINALNISMKSVGTIGGFEPVIVHNVETTEQLIVASTQSITLNERVGIFTSQSIVDNYWSQSAVSSYGALPTGALFFTESRMSDSMLFSGSAATRQFWVGDHYRVESLVSMSFFKDTEYTFQTSFHGIRKPTLKIVRKNVGVLGKFPIPTVVNDARLEIYVSGSAFETPTTTKFGKTSTVQSTFGKIIGLVDLDDLSRGDKSEGQLRNFETTFIANQDGSGSIVFVVRSGDWHFTDISVRQGIDEGFVPDYVDLVVPYPDFHRNDTVVFKCEFINSLGNRAEVFATSSETFFTGGNTYIQGQDNLITGSLYVGNFIGSGFEISGESSAYIRSINYHGWENSNAGTGSGILLWSGSVLQASTSLDPYDAVGFEIHGGSGSSPDGETHAIRFRTDTGRLEITGSLFATDGTFEGTLTAATGIIGGWLITSESLKSISGSLEMFGSGLITSSNFELQEDGFITAREGLIGGWAIGPTFLSSSDGNVILFSEFLGQSLVTVLSESIVNSVSLLYGNADNWGLVGGIGGQELFRLGAPKNHIGGWTISDNFISSSNIIIDASGSIQTADYVSDLRGWRITNDFNGFAEFENAKIRGSLSTTQFIKETVNAVGGQLWIANSTVLTGSATISFTETTWSVENASGWAVGEVAIVKKFTDTGFFTEYVRIESSSLDGDGETAFNGNLYVERYVEGGSPFVTGSVSGSLVGDTGSVGLQDYFPGQTVVSTGLSGSSGYIRLNANPRDYQTPFIDIIERTGSGVHDLDLKVRVGDLSGLDSSLLFGETNPGFGIYTQNGFFEGTITANTGTIGGWSITSESLDAPNNTLRLISTGEISSSNFFVDTGGNLTASDAIFQGNTFAETTAWRKIRIDGFNVNNYFFDVSESSVAPNVPTMSVLDLSGFTAGQAGGLYIELFVTSSFPIGFIYFPTSSEFGSDQEGTTVFIHNKVTSTFGTLQFVDGDSNDVHNNANFDNQWHATYPGLQDRTVKIHTEAWAEAMTRTSGGYSLICEPPFDSQFQFSTFGGDDGIGIQSSTLIEGMRVTKRILIGGRATNNVSGAINLEYSSSGADNEWGFIRLYGRSSAQDIISYPESAGYLDGEMRISTHTEDSEPHLLMAGASVLGNSPALLMNGYSGTLAFGTASAQRGNQVYITSSRADTACKIVGDIDIGQVPNIVPFFIRGTGFNNTGSQVLRVGNNIVYDATSRSLRFTILSKTDYSVILDVSHDTFGFTSASDALAADMTSSITQDTIGILTSFDAWEQNLTTNLKDTFNRYGLTHAGKMSVVAGDVRRPYAAIFEGAVGSASIATAHAIEVVYDSTGSNPFAEIRGWLMDGNFVSTPGTLPNALTDPEGVTLPVLVDENSDVSMSNNLIVANTGSFGRIEKSGGSFVIPHPDPDKSGTLWHSFVESPTSGDNIYRWRIETTSSGEVIFELPDYWKYLNENPQVWISPHRMLAQGSGWVNDDLSKLHMLCDKAGEYEILLIGTRKDEHARGWLGVER